jgi:hypothetical protein
VLPSAIVEAVLACFLSCGVRSVRLRSQGRAVDPEVLGHGGQGHSYCHVVVAAGALLVATGGGVGALRAELVGAGGISRTA